MLHGSPVKITLRPGQEMSWGFGYSHEEGYSSESYEWTHDGDSIREEHCTDGRDCDGRIGSEQIYTALLTRLTGSYPYLAYVSRLDLAAWDDVSWPQWERASASQRDYSAEAAGY